MENIFIYFDNKLLQFIKQKCQKLFGFSFSDVMIYCIILLYFLKISFRMLVNKQKKTMGVTLKL